MPVDVIIPEATPGTLDSTFDLVDTVVGSLSSVVGDVTNCGNCKDKTFRVRVQCTTCGQDGPDCGCASTPDKVCMTLSNPTGNSPIPQLSGVKIQLAKTPWESVPTNLRNAVLNTTGCCTFSNGSTSCNGAPPTNIVVTVTVAPDNTCSTCASWASMNPVVTDVGGGKWNVRGVDPTNCSGVQICNRSVSFALVCDGQGGVKGEPSGGGLCCSANNSDCININFPGGISGGGQVTIVEGPTYAPSFHIKYKLTVTPTNCGSTTPSVMSMYIDITATTGTAGSGGGGQPEPGYKVYYGTFAPVGTPYDSCRYDVLLGCCNGAYFSIIQLVNCSGASLTGTSGCSTAKSTPVCSPFSVSGTHQFTPSGSVDFTVGPVPIEGCGGGSTSGTCCNNETDNHNLTVVMTGTATNYVTAGTYLAVRNGSTWTFGPTGFASYIWELRCPVGGVTNTWQVIGFPANGGSGPMIIVDGTGVCNPVRALLSQPGGLMTLSVSL